MAKYKHYDYRQTKLLPIRFDRQILPGTFEYTLNALIDAHVDLSVFEDRYQNDDGGAPAYDPASRCLRTSGTRISSIVSPCEVDRK